MEETQMTPLTKEQKEYVEFKLAKKRMYEYYTDLNNKGLIPMCFPRSERRSGTFGESMFNNFMERLMEDQKNRVTESKTKEL